MVPVLLVWNILNSQRITGYEMSQLTIYGIGVFALCFSLLFLLDFLLSFSCHNNARKACPTSGGHYAAFYHENRNKNSCRREESFKKLMGKNWVMTWANK